MQPDPQMQWAQGCLAQIMDPSIPQTGFWNPQTHQALQTFQTQQQLPPTGLLDPNTVAALQAACSGQGADAAGGAPPPGAPSGPPPMGGGGQGAGGGGGHRGSHEIGTSQEAEFPGERRWERRERFGEERRREEHRLHDRRWPFLFEAETGTQGESEWGFGRRERLREERHREERRREEHPFRERRWPFFEAETGSQGEGEWGFGHRERVREERHREERRREEHPFRDRRWPFLFEAETGRPGEGESESEYRFRRNEPFVRGRMKWDRGWFFGLPENHRISWAQACLAQILGPWVVQDGVMGPNTVRALRAFQESHGLPLTGVLDEDTAHALHTACGR